MTLYNNEIRHLLGLLERVATHCHGYKIEDVLVENEQSAKDFGVQFLNVEPICNKTQIINSLSYVRKDIGFSTQFVARYPGLIVVERQQKHVFDLVKNINELKQELADTVRFFDPLTNNNHNVVNRRPRDKHQKHKFIHELEPGIMTEQLYRNIQVIEEPVTNAWFNWTQRPVSINLKGKNAIDWLNTLRDYPRSGFTKEQWQIRIDEIAMSIEKYDFIQHYRLLRHIPICTYQTKNADSPVRNTKNANTPFILLNQEENLLPKTSALKNWDVSTRKRKMRQTPDLIKTTLLSEPHIFGVNDNRSNKTC